MRKADGLRTGSSPVGTIQLEQLVNDEEVRFAVCARLDNLPPDVLGITARDIFALDA